MNPLNDWANTGETPIGLMNGLELFVRTADAKFTVCAEKHIVCQSRDKCSCYDSFKTFTQTKKL